MRPYVPDLHNFQARLLVLVASALLVGFGLGIVAYFVSGVIYLILVYPVVVSFAGLLVFSRLIIFARINTPRLLLIGGLLFGLASVAGYFSAPYYSWRIQQIQQIKEEYQVDTATAADAVNRYLQDEGGLPGMFGFLSMRARAGENFSSYLMINPIAMKLFDFTLKGTAAWLYWLIEAGLMVAPLAYFSRTIKQRYNRSAKALYNSMPNQIGAAAMDCLTGLVEALNRGDIPAAAAFIQTVDGLNHPLLEICERHSNGKPGTDHLLSLNSTQRVNARRVKRLDIGDWELSLAEYETLTGLVSSALAGGATPSRYPSGG